MSLLNLGVFREPTPHCYPLSESLIQSIEPIINLTLGNKHQAYSLCLLWQITQHMQKNPENGYVFKTWFPIQSRCSRYRKFTNSGEIQLFLFYIILVNFSYETLYTTVNHKLILVNSRLPHASPGLFVSSGLLLYGGLSGVGSGIWHLLSC